MNAGLLTPYAAAELLGLHVRTVRRYIREGRLEAVRVGNRYRITRESLEALVAAPLPSPGPRVRADASSVVHLEPVDRDTAQRLTTLLLAAAGSGDGGQTRLGVHVVHEAERDRLRVIVTGSVADTVALLALVTAFQDT